MIIELIACRRAGVVRQTLWPSGFLARGLVVRLKFELGVPIALALGLPGIWLNSSTHYSTATLITAAAVCLSFYLLLESSATHEALGTLRHELLCELRSTFSQFDDRQKSDGGARELP